jgi:hypothetical protein
MSDRAKAWYEGFLKQIDEWETQAAEEKKAIWKMLKHDLRHIDPSDPNLALSLITQFAGFILDLELDRRTDEANYLKEFFIKMCANEP